MTGLLRAAMPRVIRLPALNNLSVLRTMISWRVTATVTGSTPGTGDDVLDGKEGGDWLHGEAGADTLKGGDGIDLAAYWGSDVGVEVRLYDGFAQGGHAEGDTFDSIEELHRFRCTMTN